MTQKVFTTEGLIDFDALEIQDVIEVGENYRKVATEYRFNGTLVRRSVAVEALRPLEVAATEGNLNG